MSTPYQTTDRKMAFNPFEGRDFQGSPPEVIHQPSSGVETLVEKVYHFFLYHRVQERVEHPDIDTDPFDTFQLRVPVLTPDAIGTLFWRIVQKDETRREDVICGMNTLIQASYDQGYNGFHLRTRRTLRERVLRKRRIPICNLGRELSGTEDRPLHLEVDGDAGDAFASYARYCDVTVKGPVRMLCALRSDRSSFTVHGDAGEYFLDMAELCTATVYGKVHPETLNESRDCVLRIRAEGQDKRMYALMPRIMREGNNRVELLP